MKGGWSAKSPWPLRSVREICHRTELTNPRTNPAEAFVYVDIGSVDNETRSIIDPKHLTGDTAPSRARKRIRRNDVILATTRPYLKSITMVNEQFDGQICSTGFAVLRAKECVDPEWLFHAVTSDEFVSQLTAVMRGANYPAVRDSDVFEASIPVPPLDEQRRIVARIQECLSRVEEMERLQAKVVEDFGALEAAVLSEIEESIPSCRVPLESVLKQTRNGKSSEAKRKNHNCSVLTLSAVQKLVLDSSSHKGIELEAEEQEKFRIAKGEVYISRANTTQLVGLSSYVANNVEEIITFPDLLIQLTPSQDAILPEYLALSLRFPTSRKQIQERAIGSSRSMVKISGARLKEVKIPLPSLARQSAVFERYVQFSKAVQEARGRVDRSFPALRNAILRQAFAGEL